MKTIEQRLTDVYLYNTDLLDEDIPVFIRNCRREALETFNLLGLPYKNNEKYKYSDIRSLYEKDNYEKYFSFIGGSCGEDDKLGTDIYEIRTINGFCSNKLTVLENGIIYGSLKMAANEYPELISRYYNKLAEKDNDAVSSLNTMFMQDGTFIFVPEEIVSDKSFSINNCFVADENIYSFNRNLIILGKNSNSRIIVDSHTMNGNSYLINNLTEVILGENTVAEIVELQKENTVSTHLSNFYAEQPECSNLKVIVVAIDGGFIRNNWNVYLVGPNAEAHNYGLYITGTGQSIDNYTNTEHRVADCTSFEKYKGIASGSSKGIFNGRILVDKDAQRTRAFQENHNLVLDDDAVIDSKPQLEIYADDVKCSHGATVGQLDKNAVFYMRQRGIKEEDAKKLQMYGFINDIIGKVSSVELAEIINDTAIKKIENL